MFVNACQTFGRSCVSKGVGLIWGHHHISGILVRGRLYGSLYVSGRLYGSQKIIGSQVSGTFSRSHQINGLPIRYGYFFFNIRCLHHKQLITNYRHIFQLYNVICLSARNFNITSYCCEEFGTEHDQGSVYESNTPGKFNKNTSVNIFDAKGNFIVKISMKKAMRMAEQRGADLVPIEQPDNQQEQIMSYKLEPITEIIYKDEKSKAVNLKVPPFITGKDLELRKKKLESALKKGKVVKIAFVRHWKKKKTYSDSEEELQSAKALYWKMRNFIESNNLGTISEINTDKDQMKRVAVVEPILKSDKPSETKA